MLWESVFDDVIVEALFVGLCWATETVDGILLEALFLALSSGSQSLMMFLWRACFWGDIV